jgi:hypothetical protein
MGIGAQDLYLINSDSELHLRDARHAMQLFTEHGHALGPKTKFLYHVVFEYSAPLDKIANSSAFRKEIGVLVKTIDLPKFRATVDTKNQYNRKKRVQTRIDYDDINIRFHDDNTGLTRAMLEEYYKYYSKDGHKNDRGKPLDFGQRDQFTSQVPRYGMDTGNNGPFFSYIRIYQLARHKWASYTLVNPILTAWGHDDMSYSDGSGIMENNMTVAYESVLYNAGDINGEPVGFTDQETRYDQVHSPLQSLEAFQGYDPVGRRIEPVVIQQFDKYDNTGLNTIGSIFRNISSGRKDPRGILSSILNSSAEGRQINRLGQIIFPSARGASEGRAQGGGRPITIAQTRVLNGDGIRAGLTTNRAALNVTVKRALATGAYSLDWNSRNFSDFNNLSTSQQSAIENDIINRAASGDKKIAQIASESIATNKG